MQADKPLAEGPANLLYETENAHAPARIAWTVHVFGNWVGGRVRLHRDGIDFEMNRMNASLQHDTGARSIAAGEVTSVNLRRGFLGLGISVDLATARGPLRIRCFRRLRDQIVETAKGWVAANRR